MRKVRVGTVVSDKMDKTVVVAVERVVSHPLYGRRMKRTTRFMAHNEDNLAKVGDKVRVMETRPLSKEKKWRVVEILERAK
ncbi:MAG: 30S ribosomal protein S17 [Bacillota bacterium]